MTEIDSEFTAVQEDPSSFAMDWPVIGSPEGSDEGGSVFILDRMGRTVSFARLDVVIPPPDAASRRPDDAADGALEFIGWARRGPWVPDGFGRHTARVVAIAPHEPIPTQTRSSLSLAEEAALHFA
jgi:hypothetical protein